MARIPFNFTLQMFFIACYLRLGGSEHESNVLIESNFRNEEGASMDQSTSSYPFSPPYHAIVIPLAKLESAFGVQQMDEVPIEEQSPPMEKNSDEELLQLNTSQLITFNTPPMQKSSPENTNEEMPSQNKILSDDDLPPTLHKIPYDTFPVIQKQYILDKNTALNKNTSSGEQRGSFDYEGSLQHFLTDANHEESLNRSQNKNCKKNENHIHEYSLGNENINERNTGNDYSLKFDMSNNTSNDKSTHSNEAVFRKNVTLKYFIKPLNETDKTASNQETHSVLFEGYEKSHSSCPKTTKNPNTGVMKIPPSHVCHCTGCNCKCLQKVKKCVRDATNFADYLAKSACAVLKSLGEID